MDKATQARIFEPFFTTKERGRGTGLGLPSVYGIVKQSNGYIEVHSELGTGTVFRIYLPCVQAEASEQATSEAPVHEIAGDKTILLVEDEAQVRNLTGRILRTLGCRVLEAPDGSEALRIAQEYEGGIDLVITDVVMPKMSGKALVTMLESIRPGIKSLYVSGYTDDEIVNHGILDSRVAFLQKPFTLDSLTSKVAGLIQSA
jgi:CheY-like chemotaxis protein